MYTNHGLLFAFGSALCFFKVASVAPRASGSSYSSFIYPTGHGNLTFSVSAATSGDVYMHLSGPATYSWVGVGTGSEMAGSVMWIVYEGANKDSLTLSPRLSDDEVEPSYSSDVDCTLLNGSIAQTNNTRYYSAEIHCKNLTALGTGDGKLDLSNKKQPFLYAWGPTDGAISSTSKTANMKRHDAYGTFFADMTQATSDSASVPSGVALTTTANAEADGDATSDGDKVGPAHAAIMLATFGLVFPLGAVLLRLLESVKIHGIVQGVGVLTAVVGVALGIYLGTMYNKSKDVSSGHQVFGLILLALLLIQWGIGLYHHLRFRRKKRPTVYGTVHRFAGPAIVLGGIINGFVGFDFSGDPHNNVYWGIAVAVILVVVFALLGWKRWVTRRRTKSDGITSHGHESYRMS